MTAGLPRVGSKFAHRASIDRLEIGKREQLELEAFEQMGCFRSMVSREAW